MLSGIQPMTSNSAISLDRISFRYADRSALDEVSFDVMPGELFALVGPNGGGKTTLFRLLATLIPLQQGKITVMGSDLASAAAAVRRSLGVVFQAPSLDKKLTVRENLLHQGHLYGLRGAELKNRSEVMLAQLGISDRASDLVETLSGGLRRRVELAKGLLHHPQILLLDEPTTGLDPGARSDLWHYLGTLRDSQGLTIFLTTHLLEEAERADRVAILDRGHLVALDTPSALRDTLSGDTITIETEEPAALAADITERFAVPAQVVGQSVRLSLEEGARFVPQLSEAFASRIQSITLGRPTLEDVFIERTGHRFWQNEAVGAES